MRPVFFSCTARILQIFEWATIPLCKTSMSPPDSMSRTLPSAVITPSRCRCISAGPFPHTSKHTCSDHSSIFSHIPKTTFDMAHTSCSTLDTRTNSWLRIRIARKPESALTGMTHSPTLTPDARYSHNLPHHTNKVFCVNPLVICLQYATTEDLFHICF